MKSYIEEFYIMKFNHEYADGKLILFEEVLDGNSSYWINASEKTKYNNEQQNVAIKFSKNQLAQLRDVLIEMNLEE